MTDDRSFDALRSLDRRLEPRPAFADELFATLVVEAGLSPGARAGGFVGRSRGLFAGLRRTPTLRLALVGLLLLALLATAIVIVGGLLRGRQAFEPVQVEALDVGSATGWATNTLAAEGDVGGQPSVATIGGSTSVATVDMANGRVLAARCADPGCASLGPTVDAGPIIPNVLATHRYAATAADGGLWIAGANGEAGGTATIELRRVCPEPAGGCSPTVPTSIGRGDTAVVAIRPDGRPVVVFGMLGSTTATVFSCVDASCSAGTTAQVPAAPTDLDVAVLADGRLTLATGGNRSIRVLTCTDGDCTNTTTSTLGPGRQPRIAVGHDGAPVVAAFDDRAVVLYRCLDPGCGSGSVAAVAELGQAAVGADEIDTIDLAVGPDDRPLISFGAGGVLRLVACGSADCSSASRIDLAASSPALAAPHAIGLDPSGHPFVVFGARSDLQVVRCATDDCLSDLGAATPSSGTGSPDASAGPHGSGSTSPGGAGTGALTVTTVEQVNDAYSPAVTVGPDGRPLAVYAVGGDAVHVLRCGDERCANGNTIETVRASEPAGSAIAIDADGDPVLAFASWSGTITIVRCDGSTCPASAAATPIGDADMELIGVTVPEDDRPIVAYVAAADRAIRLARCVTPGCAAVSSVTIDSNQGGWPPNSLEIRLGSSGAPMLAIALANGEVRYARCDGLDCRAPTLVTVGTKALDKTTAALGIGPDGGPTIAFYSDGSLLVGRCADVTCATVPTVRVDAATAGWWSPVGVGYGSTGSPRIVYFSPTNRDTKLAVCGDPVCASADLIPVDASDANGADDATGVAFRPDGAPIIVYVRDRAVIAESCADDRCGA
jgi:hypothetical protein